MVGPNQIRFVADRMLGRLAKMLRLLGYDTRYEPALAPAQLQTVALQDDRVVLSRGDVRKRFCEGLRLFSVPSDYPPEQLCEVVKHFSLDSHTGLWTRCTLCNAEILPIEKSAVAGQVPPKAFHVYDQFFRCGGCQKIYWRGSHVERTVKNLERILGKEETSS